MVEHRIGNNVRIICSLEVGDMVMTDFSQSLSGKELKVENVRYHPNCESGFMVRIEGYPREMDSNWLIKVSDMLK